MSVLRLTFIMCFIVGATNGLNWTLIQEIIATQDSIYDFDNFLIFSSKNLLDEDFNLQDFYEYLMTNLSKATLLINMNIEFNARLRYGKNSLSIIIANNFYDPIKSSVDTMLTGFRTNKSIFINFNLSKLQLNAMISWIWNHQFTNTILIHGYSQNDTRVWTFKPYPVLRGLDITDKPFDSYFSDEIRDFEGYELKVPIKNDVPRILLSGGENSTNISGLIGKVFVGFLDHNNISLKNTARQMKSRSKGIDMEEIFDNFVHGDLEISVHIYTLLDTKGEEERPVVAKSYPVEIIKWCLMVPMKNEIPKSLYIVFPFGMGVWMSVFGSVLYVSVIFKTISYFQPVQNNIDNFIILTTSIAFVFNMNGFKKAPHNPSMMMFAIFGMLFAFGFVITNMYLASLSSFLTVTVFGKQINSLEDIVKENLTIQSLSHTNMYMRKALNLSESMQKFFINEDDIDLFNDNRDHLNTAYGYPITTDRWKFLDIQQKQLTNKRFRLSDICFANVFSAYMMKYDSHLQRPLEDFIMKARDAGLFSHWVDETFDIAVHMKFLKMLQNEEEEKTFTVVHFYLFFVLLFVAWSAAFVLLALEKFMRVWNPEKVMSSEVEEEVEEGLGYIMHHEIN